MEAPRKRGRPRKPRTVRVQVLLLEQQKDRLDFLSSQLPGSPPISGLVRDAVGEFLEKHYGQALEEAFAEQREQQDLRIVR